MESGGAGFRKCRVATPRNPCAAAMENYERGPNESRMSWDPLTTLTTLTTLATLTTLVAVRGARAASTRECTDCDGHNTVDPLTGRNAWVRGPKTNQTYLLLTDAKQAGDTIDTLLCQASKLNPPPEGVAAGKTDDDEP